MDVLKDVAKKQVISWSLFGGAYLLFTHEFWWSLGVGWFVLMFAYGVWDHWYVEVECKKCLKRKELGNADNH